MNNEYKLSKKPEEKFIVTDNREDGYMGISRKWCVRKLNPQYMFGEGGKQDRADVVVLDFGKPFAERFNVGGKKEEYINVYRWDVVETINKITEDIMRSGYRGNILDKVLETLSDDYVIDIEYTSYSKATSWNNHFNMRLQKKEDSEFSDNDIAKAEDIKPYLSENEMDTVCTADSYSYHTSKNSYYGKDAVEWLVNKWLKDHYTYCVKNGKNIIPDEYLADGESGIERWKKEKSSKNKANSVEKQVIKQLKQQKVRTAMNAFNDAMKFMLGEGSNRQHDWHQVVLTVDGRWSSSRKYATVRKNIIDVDDNTLITMSDEEIQKKCIKYWTGILEQALKDVKETQFINYDK